MPVESLDERTVEVLLPEGVDEELLGLYFENKRRSGGGPLVSVEMKGDRALLVFEDAEAAAQVLSKGHHVLHSVKLCVRKPAPKDRCRLLLRGVNPSTIPEMIELYVENMMGLNETDYTLYPSPERDVILIQLSQHLTKDFQALCAKVSKRSLDGAKVALEQIEQTDSILVENLHPGTSPDLLTLYFETKRGGDMNVKEVVMLSEGTAKVSFVDHQSLGRVLDLQHKLDGADLAVKPYYDFLQPSERVSPENFERNAADLGDNPMQTCPPAADSAGGQSFSQTVSAPPASQEVMEEAEEEVMEVQMEDAHALPRHILVSDPVKLDLFQLSPLLRNIAQAHPNSTIEFKHDGVFLKGTDRKTSEQMERTICEFLGNMAETSLTLEPEKVELLARKDVKERLLQTMAQSESPSIYTVSGSRVAVTSLSQESAEQACSFLKSQICHFRVPLDTGVEPMLYCSEWSEFLQALGLVSVKVAERGGNIDVWTLTGLEREKQAAIRHFLSTPIDGEAMVLMEPGVLKYIQTHCHQLLADMDQVFIFPLEDGEPCGLKLHGPGAACQMAEEVLRGMVSTVCTKTITKNAPGVGRFLIDKECKSILQDLESKFKVYITSKSPPWAYLPYQDFFDAALKTMSLKSVPRVSTDVPAQELKTDSMQTDQNAASDTGLLEETKKVVSAVDEKECAPDSDRLEGVDLYSVEGPTPLRDQGSDVARADAPLPSAEGNPMSGTATGFPSSLEEEAQLSLAIQYSMESVSHWSGEDEDEQLSKALELSRKMVQHEASRVQESPRAAKPNKKSPASLQDCINEANSIQIEVFAGYNWDLVRVEIAFGKKITQRQVRETVQNISVRNISQYHRTCLDIIQRKHAVSIEVQYGEIIVSGFRDYVPGALCDVKQLLEAMSKSASERETLRTVQWLLHDPASSDTTPYSPEATLLIENAFRRKLLQVDILLDNQPHSIDFETMRECNVTSGKTVKISRKRIDAVDWKDIPDEEYSLLSDLPGATRLSGESEEFHTVVGNFNKTINESQNKIRVIQVEKLMNRLLYNQYKLKKASVLQRATSPEVEHTLYHGTSESSMKEICVHGFNRSFCGKNATAFGQGVYFAVNASLSVQEQYSPPNGDGHKHVFVSKVLTGDFTKGCHSMKTAPLKESSDVPLRYDSVTDNITRPTLFVIFNDTQAFPEYLITCQRIQP